jgi:phosphatidylglycerol---prolipoprotein diacylglyceryl transferase
MAPVSSGIVHHPFIFHLGPVVITGYGVALALAFLLAWVVISREAERRGHDAGVAIEIVFAAAVGALIGSKLYYIILTGDVGSILSRGGLVFWGGVMGGTVAAWLLVRLRGLSFMRYADITGIAVAAGYAVGRTGCWALGDDYGRPWDSPLAVRFPEGTPPSTAINMVRVFGETPPEGSAPWSVLAVHPTQLYETALGLVMFFILWHRRDHKHAEGWLFGLYGVLAGVERFFIEFVRVKEDRLPGGLSVAQVVALTIALAGALLMYARRNVTERAPGIYATP